MSHTHTVAEQRVFSNTKHGWYELCKCGAVRTQIPGACGIKTSGWAVR